MNYSFIMEEYRGRGKAVTLEKMTGIEGPRYRVKSVSVKGFAAEAEAREAYNLLVPPKARSNGVLSEERGEGNKHPAHTAKSKRTASKAATKAKKEK